MLDLISTKTTVNDSATTAPLMDMPDDYASGDLLFALVALGAGYTLTDSSGDWTFIGTASTYNSRRLYLLSRVADGTEPSSYTLTISSVGTLAVAHVMVWRGQDGTTPVISQASADRVGYTSVSSANSPTSMTTGAVADCAIIHAVVNSSGNSSRPVVEDDSLSITSLETASSSTRLVVGWTGQSAAGAIPQINWLFGTSQSGLVCTVAIAPATEDGIPTTIKTPLNTIQKSGYSATTYGSLTGTITSLSGANINLTGTDYAASSISATTTEVAGLSTVDGLTTQWADYHQTSTATVAAGEWVGAIETLSPVQDYEDKLFSLQYATNQNSSSNTGKGGTGYIFADSSGNWAAFHLQPFTALRTNAVYCSHIACNGATPDDSSGTINWSDIKYRGIIYHRQNAAGGSNTRVYTGTIALHGSADLELVGGSLLRPIGHQWVSQVFEQADGYKNFEKFQGTRQLILQIGATFGDGTTPTYVDFSQGSVETPAETDTYWLGSTDSIELAFVGGADDTYDFRAGVFRANTPQKWTLVSDAGAEWLFGAASFIGGWDWRNYADIDLSRVTWVGARTVALGSGDHSLLSITGTTAASAAASADGNGSLTDSTLDGTGTEYALELGTGVTAYTLADCALTAGSTGDKVHVLKTSGTVTITISGSTSLASGDVTSAGATVVIDAPAIYQEVQITNLTTGSRVQIYDTTNSLELANEVSTGSTVTWTDSVAYVADRDIRVRIAYVSGASAMEFIEAAIGTVGDGTPNAATLTYRANQTADTVYEDNAVDGSAVSDITFTDSAVDKINMDISAGTIDLADIYAAWVYYAFTETGIATDIDYINAIDVANYELTNLLWKNVTSPEVPLKVTGGYAWDSATLDPMDLMDTTGGTIFLAPPHVVAKTITVSGSDVITGDIATVLAAIPSAATNASTLLTAAQSTPIHADMRKTVGTTLKGDGTEADKFRSALVA